jgi:purine-nucleoside/S-methyl-5'-thioadenosine phosphorylase / adenosine deaminase
VRLHAAEVRWTSRADGDMRARVPDPSWTCLEQVHGSRVVVVDAPGACSGEEADAAVTVVRAAHLAVFTADCAPVALASPEGVVGAVHAGWRGLEAGVVEATVAKMREMGATRVDAALGPCIHAECYDIDVPAAVRAALGRAGAELVHDEDVCTACSSEHFVWRHFSWRARREDERQAMVVWLP